MVSKYTDLDQLQQIYYSINRFLKPVLVNSVPTNGRKQLLRELVSKCHSILVPFLRFLDSDFADYDYQYNDLVGFDEGKWSAEIVLMLEKNIDFKEHDADIFTQRNSPIWVLRIVISLIHPIFIMAIERWELSKVRENWIDTYCDNSILNNFENIVIGVKNYLVGAGFTTLSNYLLAIVPDNKEIIGNHENWTVGQLLFNEVYEDKLDVLSFD